MNAPRRPARLASVIAHRGASGEAPENTLAAMRLAAEQGALAVEIDVNASADGVPYVHHDDRLDRCTDGRGLLHEQASSRLDAVCAGAGMPGHEREPLPRLEALVELVVDRGLALNLEIKPPAGRAAVTTDAICDVLERCWPADATLVFSSFDEAALDRARERLPELPRALLVGRMPDTVDAARSALARTDSINLHCSQDGLVPAVAQALANDGHAVYCYTVNDPERAARLLEQGAAGVFTDYPALLLSALAS